MAEDLRGYNERTLMQFFDKDPDLIPLFEELEHRMSERMPSYETVFKKTQVNFVNKHVFALFWIPFLKVKGRPDRYAMISFSLDHLLEDPRIIEAVEPYPKRWTHHVLIEKKEDIDDRLMEWIAGAYGLGMIK